jgi:RNA polymerase-binding transcription factor
VAKAKTKKTSAGKKGGKSAGKIQKKTARPVVKGASKAPAKAKAKPAVKPATKPAKKLPAAKTHSKSVVSKTNSNTPSKSSSPAPVAKLSKPANDHSNARGKAPIAALAPSGKNRVQPVGSSGVVIEKKPEKNLEKSMKKSKEADRKGISIPAPIPTDTKPSKNQAGLRSSELEHFRDLLLAKRRELVGDMSSMEREALQRGGSSNLSNLPLHMADMGTDNYEQEFTLGLMEKDRNLLREINNALAKIQDGTYGICEGTHQPIAKPRLEAQPWARFSIEYARKLEQRMGR